MPRSGAQRARKKLQAWGTWSVCEGVVRIRELIAKGEWRMNERRRGQVKVGEASNLARLTLEEVELDLAGWLVFDFEEHLCKWKR